MGSGYLQDDLFSENINARQCGVGVVNPLSADVETRPSGLNLVIYRVAALRF